MYKNRVPFLYSLPLLSPEKGIFFLEKQHCARWIFAMKWYRCFCAMYVVYKETSLSFWTVQGGNFLAFPQSLSCTKSPDCTKYNDTFIIFWFALAKKQIHYKWTFVYCFNIKCMSFVNNSVERNILHKYAKWNLVQAFLILEKSMIT